MVGGNPTGECLETEEKVEAVRRSRGQCGWSKGLVSGLGREQGHKEESGGAGSDWKRLEFPVIGHSFIHSCQPRGLYLGYWKCSINISVIISTITIKSFTGIMSPNSQNIHGK